MMTRVWMLMLVALATTHPGLAQTRGDFQWSGSIARGQTIEIKGVNGNVRAELAKGDRVAVVATKHADRSDLNSVTIDVVQEAGNVTICAVYPTPAERPRGNRHVGPNSCRPGGDGHMRVQDNDVVVDFTVQLPAGVRLAAQTVNGTVEAQALKSDIDVHVVNGRIAVSTSGAASAETVNGSIDASIGSAEGNAALDYKSVNGSITLKLPKGFNADLRANTVNGRFDSDVPVMVTQVEGRQKSVTGTIGKGGRLLQVRTVNGSIHLQSVTGR